MTDMNPMILRSLEEALPPAGGRPGGRAARGAEPLPGVAGAEPRAARSAEPRAEPGAPVSRANPPDDTQLFDDPADAQRKYWLPRYRLAEDSVAGRARYRLGFVEAAGSWRLELGLVAVPPPGLEEAARSQPTLAHACEIELSYATPGGPARKALIFQEVAQDPQSGDISAALLLAGLGQRDEVFQALREAGRDARLRIGRKARIAVRDTGTRGGTAGPGAGTESGSESGTEAGPEAGTVTIPRRDVARWQPIGPVAPVRQMRPHPVQPIRPVRPDRPTLPDGPILPTRPVRPIPPIRQRDIPVPVLEFLGAERYTVRDAAFVRYRLSVGNWSGFLPEHFQASPDLPPCGANTKSSRCWVDILDAGSNQRLYGFCGLGKPEDLTQLWFATADGKAPPAAVKISIVDRRRNITRVSNGVALGKPPDPEPRFRVVDATLDQAGDPAPFAFSPDLHGYIFAAVSGGGAQPPPGGLRRLQESFGSTLHSYFQDPVEPQRFYFLPDDFRVARIDGDFRQPAMKFRVKGTANALSQTSVTLTFVVVPFTDPARLDAACPALAARTRVDPAAIVMQPLATSGLRFLLQRPTANGRFDEQRPASPLMLQEATPDTITMPLPDFQMAFDAMMGRTVDLFGGRVEIDVEGSGTEARTFLVDAARLAGPLLDIAVTVEAPGWSIVLRNAIESPVRLENLRLRTASGLEFQAMAPGDQTVLAPGEAAEVRVSPPEEPDGNAPVLTVAKGARALPDDASVLNAILDRSTLEYYREIEVEAAAVLFAPIPERPSDQVLAILVEFEGGQTVELRAENRVGTARVDYPFEAVILRQPVDPNYRFRKTVVRIDNRQERDAEPTTQADPKFFVRLQL